DVGVRRQVNHHVVAVHGGAERVQLLDVAADHAQPLVAGVVRVVPLPPDEKLSYSVTPATAGSPSRWSVKWLPMKPAPPTMKKRWPAMPLAPPPATSSIPILSRRA